MNYRKYRNKDGLLHRDDGPAVEHPDGSKEWWVHGKRHREGGPAIEWSDGSKYWYINDKLHREDGPAIECHRSKEWWINDINISMIKNIFKEMELDGHYYHHIIRYI